MKEDKTNKEQFFIPSIILLATYAIIDNGETLYGLISVIVALALALIFTVVLIEESEEHAAPTIDRSAWADISDSAKWDWK